MLPISRRVVNSEAFKKVKQRLKQLIFKFVNYLKKLKKHFNLNTPEHQRDTLLNKIHLKYYQKIVKNKQINKMRTKKDIISAIAFQETYTISRGGNKKP